MKRGLEFGGWLYNGKVLAPNVSIVLYRNLLKYLFIKMRLFDRNKLFWPKRGTDEFLKTRRPNVEVFDLKGVSFEKIEYLGKNYLKF